jgi:hypothetical protein
MQSHLKIVFGLVVCCQFSLNAYAAPAANLWPYWQPGPTTVTTPISHDRWQQLLDRYVRPGDDQINRFAYHKVTAADRRLLQDYLQTLSELDPRGYPDAEQMAYWINLYNALTVQVVLAYPNKNSILRMGKGFFRIGPWDDRLITVVGERLTLNDIEHRILRPIWQDRRIHFAVNCASLGCPNLSRQVFTGANLETMLSATEHDYINHPRGVSFNAAGELVLSSLFDWYVDDFAEDRLQLLRYLSEQHSGEAERLSNYQDRIRYDYDWSLNQER